MTEKGQEHSVQKKITVHDFYFEIPLYDAIDVENINGDIFDGNVDGFSHVDKRDTTYTITSNRLAYYMSDYKNMYGIILEDKRTDSNDLFFFLYLSDDKKQVVKVGQAPSLATVQLAEVTDKYKSVLAKQDLFMLKRAIGLAAHGTGIGSYVYLRRILEDLVWETYATHQGDLDISKEDFTTQRIKEKIQTLKRFLPAGMTKLTPLYGILSKGIHELSEDECLAYFDTMKLAIELILKQRIQQKQEVDEESETIRRLQEASMRLSQGKSVKDD